MSEGSVSKNMGYYAALTFGLGYLLTLLGGFAVFVEILARGSGTMRYLQIPIWLGASMFFIFLAIVSGIGLGWSITKNGRAVRDFGLKLQRISSSVTTFSLMILFSGVAGIILAVAYQPTYPYTGFSVPLLSPISTITGAILLLVGFRIYLGKPMESKIMGGILMLASLALIYFVAYNPLRDYYKSYVSLFTQAQYQPQTNLPPLPGPLLCEVNIEVIVLLIAVVSAFLYSIPWFREERGQPIVGIVLSLSGIIFSCGVMYFNFSALSMLSKVLSVSAQQISSIWIVFFGLLVTGISGIIILVASCLPIAISIKQLYGQIELSQTAPPKQDGKLKFCPKCGTKISSKATYCPKCGKEQPQE